MEQQMEVALDINRYANMCYVSTDNSFASWFREFIQKLEFSPPSSKRETIGRKQNK